MAKKLQHQKMRYGRIQCRKCLQWRNTSHYKLIVPQGKSPYYHFACNDCVGHTKSERGLDMEVQGWPCQYCPKRQTCKTECFIYRAYVEGDIAQPETLKKLIGAML